MAFVGPNADEFEDDDFEALLEKTLGNTANKNFSIPGCSTQKSMESDSDIWKGIPADLSSINDQSYETPAKRPRQDLVALIKVITLTERKYPRFHIEYDNATFVMDRAFASKYHIVLKCYQKDCTAKCRIIPIPDIILSRDDTTKGRNRIFLDPLLKITR